MAGICVCGGGPPLLVKLGKNIIYAFAVYYIFLGFVCRSMSIFCSCFNSFDKHFLLHHPRGACLDLQRDIRYQTLKKPPTDLRGGEVVEGVRMFTMEN
jgi:hypothetical protein